MSSPAQRHAKVWAETYELIDLQLAPLGFEAIRALQIKVGDHIVDIGCGSGQTLLQLFERAGTSCNITGVDISAVLLNVAKMRTAHISNITTIEADAQTVDLPSSSADALFSRFGIMGFKDPIAAFSNFSRILKPSGRLAFTCWRALSENELDYFPLAAAALGHDVDETPFSFENENVIRDTLTEAGFQSIQIKPFEADVSSGNIDAMADVLLKVGPLGKMLRETPSLRLNAEECLRTAFEKRGNLDRVSLRAAVWIVTAENDKVES